LDWALPLRLVVGEVIAVGIFLTPARMGKVAGVRPMWLLWWWLVMGRWRFAGALCYGELAVSFQRLAEHTFTCARHSGLLWRFFTDGNGPACDGPGLTAALAAGLAGYAGYVLGISATSGEVNFAIGVILFVAAGKHSRSKNRAPGIVWLLTVRSWDYWDLCLFGVFGLRLGHWSTFHFLIAQRPGSESLIAGLAGALVGAFFSFGGWWESEQTAGEVAGAPNTPCQRALVYGVAVVTAVYLCVSTVFIYLVPIERVTTGETFAAQAGEVLFGKAGAEIFFV